MLSASKSCEQRRRPSVSFSRPCVPLMWGCPALNQEVNSKYWNCMVWQYAYMQCSRFVLIYFNMFWMGMGIVSESSQNALALASLDFLPITWCYRSEAFFRVPCYSTLFVQISSNNSSDAFWNDDRPDFGVEQLPSQQMSRMSRGTSFLDTRSRRSTLLQWRDNKPTVRKFQSPLRE